MKREFYFVAVPHWGAYSLIQLDVLVGVAHLREVALELLTRDNHREAVVVGVEAQRGLLA